MKKRYPKLPYGRQSIDESDIAAVTAVLRDDWITQGPRIKAFEAAVAGRVGAGNAVAVSSGTAALHSACVAADVGEGSEVIVPALTFAATAAAVRMTGAEVHFTDIDPETLCLCPHEVEAGLTDKTKALIPVDFAGQPCDWDRLSDIATVKSVMTIADSAHALGAEYKARPVGCLADMTCFSFHPVKSITTGEGGMTTTNSSELLDRLRRVRSHGIVRDASRFQGAEEADDRGDWYYEIQDLGMNYRISDIHCALGLSQLSKLDTFTERRRHLAALYTEALGSLELLTAPKVAKDSLSAWHLYVIQLNLPALSWSRRRVFDELKARGLGVQVHYQPLHLHPYYSKRYGLGRGDFPVAEAYYDAAITLPLFPAMTDRDVEDVCEIVTEVLCACRR